MQHLLKTMCCSHHIIRLDKYSFMLAAFLAVMMPIYFISLAWLDSGNMRMDETCYWFSYNATITFTTALLVQTVNVYFIHYLESKYPWKNRSLISKRIFWELLGVFTYSPIIAILMKMGFQFFQIFQPVTLSIQHNFSHDLFRAAVYAEVLNLITILVYEGIYVFKQWKKALVEAERLQKEHILFQYETLRSQVNPHFLFNSLNSLMAIVQKDTKLAVEFIQEFAKVYRNVLDCKDKLLIPLKEELELVNSYIYLQKIRFGENLSVNNCIAKDKLHLFVPPLSLQLLIENALKHNIVSAKKPLIIQIEVIDDYLTVSNNLQVRPPESNSTGIGLKNLKTRYELISENEPQFVLTQTEYIAKIPLINE